MSTKQKKSWNVFKFAGMQYLFGASKISNFWTSTVFYLSKNVQRILNSGFHDPGRHLNPKLTYFGKEFATVSWNK